MITEIFNEVTDILSINEVNRGYKLIEECGELITAIAQMETKSGKECDVIDEIVDVIICLESYIKNKDIELSVQERMYFKLKDIRKVI